MNIDQHNDLEAIRRLKGRYFRLLDAQEWENWSDCFTADVVAIYEGAPRPSKDDPNENRVEGRELLAELCAQLLDGVTTIHQGFMPEIELTGSTTARAIWAMYDNVRFPTCNFKGWGHYQDEYVKEDGQWKIKQTHLTRVHTEEDWL